MITSRAVIGPNVRAENMRNISIHRRGLLVDYPSDAKHRAGWCIFIHACRPGAKGTSGCLAVARFCAKRCGAGRRVEAGPGAVQTLCAE
jgi:hypothetical protein